MAQTGPDAVVLFDYSCPFSYLAQLWLDGAGAAVDFRPFSLAQAHLPPGAPPAWDGPPDRLDPTLLALAGHEVVRAHGGDLNEYRRRMFAFWHEREQRSLDGLWRLVAAHSGGSISEQDLAAAVAAIAASHERAARLGVFGTPTVLFGDRGFFVKLGDLPPDREAAAVLWRRVRDLGHAHPELLELKCPEPSG